MPTDLKTELDLNLPIKVSVEDLAEWLATDLSDDQWRSLLKTTLDVAGSPDFTIILFETIVERVVEDMKEAPDEFEDYRELIDMLPRREVQEEPEETIDVFDKVLYTGENPSLVGYFSRNGAGIVAEDEGLSVLICFKYARSLSVLKSELTVCEKGWKE